MLFEQQKIIFHRNHTDVGATLVAALLAGNRILATAKATPIIQKSF
jgi:hypothetical protein